MIHLRSCNAKLDFYPRSPCGERHQAGHKMQTEAKRFLSTLSLRRATELIFLFFVLSLFLSTLSLRRATHESADDMFEYQFLSTLSLRRATLFLSMSEWQRVYFYPRSPCGERRVHYDNYNLHCVISIHALLAESDSIRTLILRMERLFLSTLSLRRAT